MFRKSLLAASLTMAIAAISGVAFAGPQWNPTMPPWNTAQINQQASKAYAQAVAPQLRYHSTGPKSPVKHPQRW